MVTCRLHSRKECFLVQYLTQGYLSLEELGIEPSILKLGDKLLYVLSHSHLWRMLVTCSINCMHVFQSVWLNSARGSYPSEDTAQCRLVYLLIVYWSLNILTLCMGFEDSNPRLECERCRAVRFYQADSFTITPSRLYSRGSGALSHWITRFYFSLLALWDIYYSL